MALMKKIFFATIMFFNISCFAQQYDMLFATVKHDTVTILDSNAWRNCAMFNVWDLYINNNQIELYERDTASACAVCYCLFDFKVTLAGLSNGSYTADVYSFYMDTICGDTTYIGTLNFTVSTKNLKDTAHIIDEFTNECHSIDNITEIYEKPGIIIFPNPASYEFTIQYSLPAETDKGEVTLFNLQGKIIKHFKVDKDLNTLIISTSDIASGLYYYQLTTVVQNSDRKKIVVIK
jgi:hypothetical protein